MRIQMLALRYRLRANGSGGLMNRRRGLAYVASLGLYRRRRFRAGKALCRKAEACCRSRSQG
jgi:hypothetical protein